MKLKLYEVNYTATVRVQVRAESEEKALEAAEDMNVWARKIDREFSIDDMEYSYVTEIARRTFREHDFSKHAMERLAADVAYALERLADNSDFVDDKYPLISATPIEDTVNVILGQHDDVENHGPVTIKII